MESRVAVFALDVSVSRARGRVDAAFALLEPRWGDFGRVFSQFTYLSVSILMQVFKGCDDKV